MSITVSVMVTCERLRRLQMSRGYSLMNLAMRAGLTEACIRQLESGRTREPRLGDGMRLAEVLAVEPRYLAFGKGDLLDVAILLVRA